MATRTPLRFSLGSTGLGGGRTFARGPEADPDRISRPERRTAPDADAPTDRPDHAGRVSVQVQHGFAVLAAAPRPRLRLPKPGVQASAAARWRSWRRGGGDCAGAPKPLSRTGSRLWRRLVARWWPHLVRRARLYGADAERRGRNRPLLHFRHGNLRRRQRPRTNRNQGEKRQQWHQHSQQGPAPATHGEGLRHGLVPCPAT